MSQDAFTILRIDGSARYDGSVSRELADEAVDPAKEAILFAAKTLLTLANDAEDPQTPDVVDADAVKTIKTKLKLDNANLMLLTLCAHDALDDAPNLIQQTNDLVEETSRLVDTLKQSA